jgi:hypothetical protein
MRLTTPNARPAAVAACWHWHGHAHTQVRG